jgi:Tol biopolymer transport system component
MKLFTQRWRYQIMKTKSFIPLLALAFFFAGVVTSPLFAQEPEKLFQDALVKEEGEGSLQEAIEIYEKVAADPSAQRELRARALLQAGMCYEKLGKEQAREAYRKLIADFSDQKEIAAVGKEKLARLSSPAPAASNADLTIKQIWAPSQDTYGVSPDGRYLNYIDWNDIEVAIKDIQTGNTWNITDHGTWKPPIQFPDNSVWSPDSKQLAYYWYSGDSTELHIANIDGSSDRLLKKGIGYQTPWPIRWSPDGNYILALASYDSDPGPQDVVGHLVLLSVKDGSMRNLKTMKASEPEWGGDFSPDGKYVVFPIHQEEGSSACDIYLFATDGSSEKLILDHEANDRSPLWRPDGNGIVFISDRMGREDLWALDIIDGEVKGNPAVLRSNFGNQTFLLDFTENGALFYAVTNFRSDIFQAAFDFKSGKMLSEPSKISLVEDQRNAKGIWSPDGRYIAYCAWAPQNDNIMGREQFLTIYDTSEGTTRKLDFKSYASGGLFWNQPQWSPDGKSLLVHGRLSADSLQGFFLVDVESSESKPVLVKDREPMVVSSLIGYLPEFSKDGKYIFFLANDRKSIIKRDLDSGAEEKVISGDDEIFQFRLSNEGDQIIFGYYFRDRDTFFSLPIQGGEPTLLMKLSSELRPYIVNYSSDQYIIYETGSYGSAETHDIWRFSVQEAVPHMLFSLSEIFPKAEVREIEIHPDGQQVVVSVEIGQGEEIWRMENLFRQ